MLPLSISHLYTYSSSANDLADLRKYRVTSRILQALSHAQGLVLRVEVKYEASTRREAAEGNAVSNTFCRRSRAMT